MSQPTLFAPAEIGDLRLAHRVVMAPLTRFRADDAHVPHADLVAAYYAQRAFHKKSGKYALAAGDLGLKEPPGRLQVQATRSGFEVSWADKDGKPRYTITHDGRLRKE